MSYVNRTLRSLPFGRVIGGPMVAAIQAQSLAAQATVNFIKEVGFKRPSPEENEELDNDGDFGDVRNVVFKFSRKKTGDSVNAGDDDEEVVTLTVPILTIVPIPYIRIEELNIQFTADITEQQEFSYTQNNRIATDTSIKYKAGNFLSPIKVGLNAKVSTRTDINVKASRRNQTQYTIDINLKAVQDDMPAGLARILSIMEAAILEKPTPVSPQPGS